MQISVTTLFRCGIAAFFLFFVVYAGLVFSQYYMMENEKADGMTNAILPKEQLTGQIPEAPGPAVSHDQAASEPLDRMLMHGSVSIAEPPLMVQEREQVRRLSREMTRKGIEVPEEVRETKTGPEQKAEQQKVTFRRSSGGKVLDADVTVSRGEPCVVTLRRGEKIIGTKVGSPRDFRISVNARDARHASTVTIHSKKKNGKSDVEILTGKRTYRLHFNERSGMPRLMISVPD